MLRKCLRPIARCNSNYSRSQWEQMTEHLLIQVTPKDEPIQPITKLDAHAIKTAQLHRAFSLFIVSEDNDKMLLQRRAAEKITFPSLWTNACCSHPRWNPEEKNMVEGVKIAAVKRVHHELGMNLNEDNLNFLGRVLYEAASCDEWIEKELDYLLVTEIEPDDIKLNTNDSEVSETKWATLEDIHAMPDDELTPWFRMIRDDGFLEHFWKNRNFAPDHEKIQSLS